MSPQNWDKIKEIFLDAIEIDAPDERADFLTKACAGDEELRGEVEKLIVQDKEAESLMNQPLIEESGIYDLASSIDDRDPLLGKIIGAYRLEKEIGRGGMGTVYIAERADGFFRQRVAVKLIKRGMDTDFILRRFRQERQILASLNHPFIARLLDGGTTDDNLPYFVMEFIEGSPLYKFCDQKKLSINERLKLFRRICQAIDFAHQNNVIHRDIKPPNILVTEDGMPKLLDFGIAKVLNPELSLDSIDPTATAMRLMTPEYASPEQVCGGEITPASDIYSLGVLLYELLTGHRPYQFQNRAPHEIARVICEEEPLRPSTGITREDNLLPTNAASQATTLIDVCLYRGKASIEDLKRELSDDIERIILKSLRKEPDERYQTAADFAEDITRYLDGKPVVAESYSAPASPKPAVQTGAATKSLAVLPLKILNLTPSVDTGEEFLSVGLADAMITRLSGVRRLAVRPTSAVLRYSVDGANPLQAGKELAVDFVLDGRIKILGKRIRVSSQLLDVKNQTSVWAEQFDETFTDALELEDSISQRVIQAILPQLTENEKQKIKKRGTDNHEAFEAYLRGRHYWNNFTEEGFAKALIYYNRAISIAPDYALAYAGIADYYNLLGIYAVMPFQETSAAAKEAAQKAVTLDENLAEGYAALGFAVLMRDFDWAQAEKHLRRAVELNPNYVTGLIWYCCFLGVKGESEEALKQIRHALKLDPLTPIVPHTLNLTLYYAGHFEEAIAGGERLVEREPRYGLAQLFLSSVMWKVGRTDEAVRLANRAVLLLGRTPYSLAWLTSAYAASGETGKARDLIAEIEESAVRRYISPYLLAVAYANLRDTEKTLELLEKAAEIRDGRLIWLGVDPQFDELRGHPRFDKVLRKTNNPLVAAHV